MPGTLQPRQLKMFTIQPFTEKVCHPACSKPLLLKFKCAYKSLRDSLGKKVWGGPEILCLSHPPGDADAAALQITVSSMTQRSGSGHMVYANSQFQCRHIES